MGAIFQKHCNDEALVFYLDGELTAGANKLVRRHLQACWKCRNRLAGLEEQIQKLAETVEDPAFPDPDWVAEQHLRFASWQEQFEKAFTAVPRFPAIAQNCKNYSLAVALVCVVLLCGLFVTKLDQGLQPHDVVSRAGHIEDKLFQKPVHQTFQVNLVQLRPTRQRVQWHLDVWADSRYRRFASRWTESDGSLKHAVWQPDRDRGYIYNPLRSQGIVEASDRPRNTTLWGELSDPEINIEKVERGLIAWLEGRLWRPISFSRDLAQFASQEGVLLQVSRKDFKVNKSLLTVSAQFQDGEIRREVILELDGQTFLPRLQSIRVETPKRSVELVMIAAGAEAMTDEEISLLRVFEPQFPIVERVNSEPARFEPVEFVDHPLPNDL